MLPVNPQFFAAMSVDANFSLGSVNTALTPQERFQEFMQTRGKRITRQRQVIVDHITTRHEHFDAEQLLVELKKTTAGAQASRPTIYRTLNEMVEAGILKKMELDGRAVYEHDYGYPQHDHLYCTSCQKLIEFSSEELTKLRNAVAETHQFRCRAIGSLCLVFVLIVAANEVRHVIRIACSSSRGELVSPFLRPSFLFILGGVG